MYSSNALLTAARPAAGAAAAAAAVTAALARLLPILTLHTPAAEGLGGLVAAMEPAGSGLQAAAWASMTVRAPGRGHKLVKVW
jgi:uncharacterized protein YidB (DUF937 family)